MASDGLRVLSLDGPPLVNSALSEPLFLQQIAHRWAFKEDDEDDGAEGDDVRVSDMFDVICGCGIGGLYAILFARLKMTIGQVLQFHRTLQNKLFAADCWAQADHQECILALDHVLDQMISSYGIEVDLNHPFFSKDCKKCYIVVLDKATSNKPLPRALRTYKVRSGSSPRCTIRQALHITLGDLQHLPAVSAGDEQFFGAAGPFPNPSRLLVKELAAAFPKLNLACFVSIGADFTCPENKSRFVGQDLLSQFQDLDCFFRLSLEDELDAESSITSLVMGYIQGSDVSELMDKIVEAIEDRKPVVNMLRLDNLAGEDGRSEIRRNISRIGNELDNSLLREIISWLSSGYSIEVELEALRSACISGSGKWLLEAEEMSNWMTGQCRLLLLKGPPGCGKTILASLVSTHLRDKHPEASFSVLIKYSSNMTISTVLARLVVQLLSHSATSVPPMLQEIYHSKDVNADILKSFIRTAFAPFKSPIFLVLDALDEFTSSKQNELVMMLLDLCPYLQLFVTTRHIPDRFASHPSHHFIELKESNGVDLRHYVTSKVTELSFISNSSTKAELTSQVINASNGIFLLASLHVRELSGCLSPMKAQEVAANLPRTHTKCYDHSIQRLRDKPPHHRELAIHTLMWIWAAKHPLTLGQLSFAVASSTVDLTGKPVGDALVSSDKLVELCDGLVAPGSKYAEFIHYTTQEYFDSGGSQVFSDILPSIGLGCLRYLNASHSPSVVQEWTEKHKLNRDPSWISEEHRYFYYCSRFWGEHARGTPAGLLGGFRTLFMNSESFSLSSRIRAEFGHGWKDPAETAWTPIHIAVFFGLETLVIQLLEEEKDATPTDKLVVTADQRDDAGRSPLSWACEKGHLGIVTLLLGRDDVEINSQDDNGQSPLLWACKNGHLHIVQLLVRNDVNVSSRDNNGQSPFLWACKTGHLNVVQHLLLARDDVDVDSQDNSGRSPLSWACGGGYRDVVRLLLSHSGIDVNSQDNKGRPPLSLACLGGRVDVVRLLLEHKNLKVNSRDSGGLSPLTWACLWGHCDVVRLLLAHGDVEVNSPDASGLSPLSRACLAGHYDVVRLLLAHKDVEVNSRDSGGLSALIWASRWGRLDIVQLLLVRRDVDVNSRDSKGRSPLSWACENRHPDIVKSLLARRELEVNSRDADGLSPLSCACEKGHLLIAEQLLDHDDVDTNSRDEDGQSPLFCACKTRHLDVVQLLLARDDVDVNLQDNNGQSPLTWACEDGCLDVVQLLLSRRDLKINSRDNKRRSPLLWACLGGHLNIVKLLVGRDDIESNYQDYEGSSPLSWACQRGCLDIVAALLNLVDMEVNSQDAGGLSPFTWACLGGHHDVVRRLLAFGNLDINSRDGSGLSPLAWACKCGRLGIVELLLARSDVEINSRDNVGQSPFSWACIKGYLDVVKVLLAHNGVEVDLRDSKGRSPLLWACIYGRFDIVQLLLGHRNVMVDSRDSKGPSPLSWARKNSHLSIAQVLLNLE